MDQLSGYAHRPFHFVLRYLRQRRLSHLCILTAVVAAVACSVGTQYGVKYLVDSLSAGAPPPEKKWVGFVFVLFVFSPPQFLFVGAGRGRELPLFLGGRGL